VKPERGQKDKGYQSLPNSSICPGSALRTKRLRQKERRNFTSYRGILRFDDNARWIG